MCLIAYSSKGAAIPTAIIDAAAKANDDGIGIMSVAGVEKWLGGKRVKNAKRYIDRVLIPNEIPFAMHFRWATHGAIMLSNCHPFQTPDEQHYVMHNGVISSVASECSVLDTDTAIFMRKHLESPAAFDDKEYYSRIERLAGYGNKLLIMNQNGEFKICNESAGTWIGDFWYSNTFSIPSDLLPARTTYADTWYRHRQDIDRTYKSWNSVIGKWEEEPRKDYGYYDSVRHMWIYGKDSDKGLYDAQQRLFAAETKPSSPVILLADERRKRGEKQDIWNDEDRKSYYAELEARMNGKESDAYYDTSGSTAKTAAQTIVSNLIQTVTATAQAEIETVSDKDDDDELDKLQPIGGDFPAIGDDSDSNEFKRYLKAVARHMYI